MRFTIYAIAIALLFATPSWAQTTCAAGEVLNPDTGLCEVDNTPPPDEGLIPKLIRFLTPDNGDSFTAGTTVTPTGRSSLNLVQNLPLDLTIVLDRSASMSRQIPTSALAGTTITPGSDFLDIAKTAVTNLISVLPDGTELTIVDFSTDVQVATTKTVGDSNFDGVPDIGISNVQVPIENGTTRQIASYVNNLRADGLTFLKDATNAAKATLDASVTDALPDEYDREILVLTDGLPSVNQELSSFERLVLGGYGDITAVALPGIPPEGAFYLENEFLDNPISSEPLGQFLDFSGDPQGLLDAFSSDSTVLSGLTSIEITDPDGNSYNVSSDALGNFTLNDYVMKEGDNVFTALATFADSSQETATLTLVGTSGVSTTPVPLPAGMWLMLVAIGALVVRGRNNI